MSTIVDTPQKLGRPVKRTEAYYRQLYDDYQWLCQWHVAQFGTAAESVQKLLLAYFKDQFIRHGCGGYRAESADFGKKIKSMCNRISEAKTLERTNPRK